MNEELWELARRRIADEISCRCDETKRSNAAIASNMAANGISRSSGAARRVYELCAREVDERGTIVVREIERVLRAAAPVDVTRLSERVQREGELALYVSDLRQLVVVWRDYLREGPVDLQKVIDRAIRRVRDELHLLSVTLDREAVEAAARATPHISAPGGTVQTGDHATASVANVSAVAPRADVSVGSKGFLRHPMTLAIATGVFVVAAAVIGAKWGSGQGGGGGTGGSYAGGGGGGAGAPGGDGGIYNGLPGPVPGSGGDGAPARIFKDPNTGHTWWCGGGGGGGGAGQPEVGGGSGGGGAGCIDIDDLANAQPDVPMSPAPSR